MSTVVCQGLQPCLEPHHVEATTMRLKLVAPKSLGLARGLPMADSDIAKEIREKCHTKNDLGGWSFLQSLSSQTPKNAMETESSYVHPMVKQSSLLKLSEKSLELCTESLGSETGSETSESSILSLSSLEYSTIGKSIPREERNSLPQMESRKVISRNFPPPLTTISGSNSLQVRPHREGGRLIIQAMENPSINTLFQAKRSHGRLRLSFWKDAEENEESGEEDEVEVLDFENEHSDEERAEEQEDGGGYDGYGKKDMEGNCFDVEVEFGMEKFQRPSRCKEDGHHGDKGLCNWEPFNWVATS